MNITKKEIKRNYKNIVCVGYCEAQFLLIGLDKIGSNCGVYGWNFNAYQLNYNTVLLTGYRNFTGLFDYNIVRKYDKKAREIYEARDKIYSDKFQEIAELRNNYVNEVLGGNNND